MRPEEIDKLFKERLGKNAPTPPADVWSRLQERMQAEALPREEEEVKVVPLQPEKKKQKRPTTSSQSCLERCALSAISSPQSVEK